MTVFAALVVPSMLSVFVLMADLEHARLYMFLPFVCASPATPFALFAGMRFGKHKLAPHLSPKKTIEGSVGGFLGAALCCVLYGLVIGKVLGHAPVYWVLALYGLLGSLGLPAGRPVLQLYQAPVRHQGLRPPVPGTRRGAGPL